MHSLLLLLSIAGLFASAEPSIIIHSGVAAGDDMKIATNTTSWDGIYDKYALFLSMEAPTKKPPHHDFIACYFCTALKLDTNDVVIQIPASIGSDDSYYRITALAYSADPNAYQYDCNDPVSYVVSGPFNFTGGTEKWSQFETEGLYDPGNFWNIPCSSYDCVRQCNQAGYPQNLMNYPNNYHQTYGCIAACPGVTYRSFDAYFGPCSSVSSTAGSTSTQSAVSSKVTTHVNTVTKASITYTTPAGTGQVLKPSAPAQPSGSTQTSRSASQGVNRKLYLVMTSILGFLFGGIMT